MHTRQGADIQAVESADQFPFNWHCQQSDPGTFLGSARIDGIEMNSDPQFEQESSSGLSHLTINFIVGILCLGAMDRQKI